MALCCAISNEVPEHPVVSQVSGSVFERRLIEKYIADNGVDPTNGKELTVDQLVDIKTPPITKPKVPSATSIPAILKSLQDEWDSVMLHSFTLRQQLQTARQELSHALYQHDAACRVIARLNKELNETRDILANIKPHAMVAPSAHVPVAATAAEVSGAAAQPTEAAGLTPEIIAQLQDKATVLTQERKRRGKTVPEGLANVDQIKTYKTIASHPGLHSASMPGILSMDLYAADNSRILTGGNDRCATVFNKDTEQVVAILKGHTKKVTKVIYHPEEDVAITASPDSTIRVWNITDSNQTAIIRAHEGPVTGLSLHATGEYVVSTSEDQYWAFSNIRTGRLLTKVADPEGSPLTAAQFHPDGLIFGTGTQDSQIKIWDLKEQTNVANFPGHSGPVSALSFSENGYYLATAAEDSCVKLWDLRKLKNFKTIQLDEGYEVKDLCFDQSGTYLAIGGTDIRIYLSKQWECLKVFNDHTALAMGVRFGSNAQFVASVSMDRTLKIYGVE
nr:EOG090X0489 [Eulimnadia texana]